MSTFFKCPRTLVTVTWNRFEYRGSREQEGNNNLLAALPGNFDQAYCIRNRNRHNTYRSHPAAAVKQIDGYHLTKNIPGETSRATKYESVLWRPRAFPPRTRPASHKQHFVVRSTKKLFAASSMRRVFFFLFFDEFIETKRNNATCPERGN